MNKHITLKIKGMECPNCAMTLESIEDRLAGVTSAVASYRRAQLAVEYDDSRVSLESIRAEVVRLGYEVVDT